MKRFYNKTIMSKVSKRTLQVFALLCVLLGVSATANADLGFFGDGAWNVCVNNNYYSNNGYGSTHSETINLGEIKPGSTKIGFWAKTWKEDGDICGVFPFIKITKGSSAIQEFTQANRLNHSHTDGKNQTWQNNEAFTIPVGLSSGEYKLTVYFQIEGHFNGGSGCNLIDRYLSNSGNNYTLTFIVPECPKLSSGQYIKVNLNKGSAQQNQGWNGDNPYIYALDCNGNELLGGWQGTQTTSGTYIFEPGDVIPSTIIFSSEYNFDGKRGKTADITTTCNGKGFEVNKEYTITLTGRHDGANGESRIFAHTISCKDFTYEEPEYTYALAGTFNNWSTTANTCDIKKGEKCTQSFELTKGTYKFKVLKDGVWYGKNNTTLGPTNSNAVTTTVNTSGGDIQLTASQDGFYSFIFWEEGGEYKVKVTYDGVGEEPVLISRKPAYDAQMQNVDLYGYIQKTLCQEIGVEKGLVANYGFFICPGSASSPCVPNAQSQQLQVSGNAIHRGDEFSYQVNYKNDHIIPNAVYGYRAYVEINDKIYLSKEVGTFMLPGECYQPEINLVDPASRPIVYTIDASLGKDHADDCNLVYGSLQTALDRLESIANDNTIEPCFKYTTNNKSGDDNSINLNAPIIFNIKYFDNTPEESSKAYCYEGTNIAGVSGGGPSSEGALALIIKDINRFKTEESYTLTLQNGSNDARPWLHHVILRNSRNVVLDNLALFSDPSNKNHDDALEFDINSKSWDNLGGIGAFTNAQIVVKNCMIGSNGFTGVHASAYDGITFENNEFEAIMDGSTQNDIDYGASAKFLACSNIQFVRNNFRGAHATLLWIQECENALFMNNVFWNTNQYTANCAAVRLIDQFAHPVTNIGFYYNTFFLEDDKKTSEHKYDFLHYSSINSGNTPAFSNVEFMYNNCYSYDTDLPGKDQDPTTKNVSGANYCPNNFWSENDNANFAFGNCSAENTHNINVKDEVCGTSATGPSSLKVKGDNLNKGVRPTTTLAQTLGVPADYTADRYNDAIRPAEVSNDDIAADKGWTFGAYQSQQGVEVSKIYWVGLSTDWDDRNNWGYYPSENKPLSRNATRATEQLERLSCTNNLSDNLHVVIPEKSILGMAYKWPQIPANFEKGRKNQEYHEEVSAGKGTGITPTQYASTIEVEYGAAIKGVEYLGAGTYYTQAISQFIAPRKQWILVGNVVKPFDNEGNPRNLKSGDYFLGYEPNVYMHDISLNAEGQASWEKSFASLEREIYPDSVFAINIPDEYGKGRIPASYYYHPVLFPDRDDSKQNDGTLDKTFYFTGRFVNETAMPSYQITEGQARLMNNSYPCNISAKKIEEAEKGNVSYYNYKEGTFFPLGSEDVMLKPQHGFVFAPTVSGTLEINYNMLADGSTRSRSAEQPLPYFELTLKNGNGQSGMSQIIVRYDAEHTNGVAHMKDTKKVFAAGSLAPELYMVMYDAEYARLYTAKAEQTIPLGIELKQDMSVRFAVANNNQYSQIILVDKLTGNEYDLLQHSYTTGVLAAGKLEGRYYLNLVVEDEYDIDPEIGSGSITTDIEAAEDELASISILVENSSSRTVRVVGNNTTLQTIYVSDMAGRTMSYNVGASAVTLQLPVAQGVYMVQVIGDNATRTEKVIVK